MPTLTRRRSHDSHREIWLVSYGDIPVGTIGKRAGVPADLDQWGWTCGFYPGVEPRQHRHGSAPTFEEARAAFEEAWNFSLPTLSEAGEAAFDEWRSERDFRAKIREKRARGEKPDTEIPSSMMRCVCGVVFDSHDPEGSLPHRRHIYATQAEQKC
jgi:hypothetical protein